MPNKAYWNTLADIMEFTNCITGNNDEENVKDIRRRAEKASDKPMEEITLAGLVTEFFEVAGETVHNYRNAKSDEERASILLEVHEAGRDIFGTIAEEASEASDYIKSRLKDIEEDNRLFEEDMHEIFNQPKKNGFTSNFDAASAETWRHTKPVLGDHIRVERLDGLFYHHGIYIGNGRVIHFSAPGPVEIIKWDEATVIETSLEDFLKSGAVEVRQYTDAERLELYSPGKIVANAKQCLGFQNYNLIFNNCEHFANSCTTGRHRSPQVEEVFRTVLLLSE